MTARCTATHNIFGQPLLEGGCTTTDTRDFHVTNTEGLDRCKRTPYLCKHHIDTRDHLLVFVEEVRRCGV